jgi:aminoglycoside N3'-acetyltransferase
MHLERLYGVPYRYEKTFDGTTRKDGVLHQDSVIHYVRNFEINFDNDRTEIGRILESDPRCRAAKLGYRNHLCMSARDIGEVVKNNLDANPYGLVKYPAVKPS